MCAALRPRADRLRYRLPSFQRKIAAALAVVEDCCRAAERPAVSVSGGKDSLVALALAAHVQPGIDVVFGDEELIYPGTVAYVRATVAALGGRLHIITGGTHHGGWFDSWRMPPYWRTPPPDMHWIGPHSEPWARGQGFDATILGLRKAESGRRRQYLAAKGRLHDTRAGLRCNPLANWTTDAVWSLIAGWELPYHPAYDRLAAIGVPRDEQRIGPLPLTQASVLQAGWPDLYARLVTRYGRRWYG